MGLPVFFSPLWWSLTQISYSAGLITSTWANAIARIFHGQHLKRSSAPSESVKPIETFDPGIFSQGNPKTTYPEIKA